MCELWLFFAFKMLTCFEPKTFPVFSWYGCVCIFFYVAYLYLKHKVQGTHPDECVLANTKKPTSAECVHCTSGCT